VASTIHRSLELGSWMDKKISVHPLFERVTDGELEGDAVIPLLFTGTEVGRCRLIARLPQFDPGLTPILPQFDPGFTPG